VNDLVENTLIAEHERIERANEEKQAILEERVNSYESDFIKICSTIDKSLTELESLIISIGYELEDIGIITDTIDIAGIASEIKGAECAKEALLFIGGDCGD
jgi:hypothetical protein